MSAQAYRFALLHFEIESIIVVLCRKLHFLIELAACAADHGGGGGIAGAQPTVQRVELWLVFFLRVMLIWGVHLFVAGRDGGEARL